MAASHPPVDKWSRYRVFLRRARGSTGDGRTCALADRRAWAIEPHRDSATLRELGGFEVKRRRRFARMVLRGTPPVDALATVLGLGQGPIPELQTTEAFQAFWTLDRLCEAARRWCLSRVTLDCYDGAAAGKPKA